MTALAAPGRSLDQRMESLQRANDVRMRRAELKRDLKARRIDVLNVLANPPAYVLTMKVLNLLLATPKFGRVKAGHCLVMAGLSPSRTIGGISPRQRAELCAAVQRRGLR